MQPRFPSPSPRAPGSPEKPCTEGGAGAQAHALRPQYPLPGGAPSPPSGSRAPPASGQLPTTPSSETCGTSPAPGIAPSREGRGGRSAPGPSPPCTPRWGLRRALTYLAGPGRGRAGPGRAGPGPGVGTGLLGRSPLGSASRSPLAGSPLVAPSLRRRRHCPYSNCTVQPKPRMMLATPFLVSPRARGVLPCLKGAAAAGPPTPSPPPPTPASEARTGSAGPLLPRLCPPVGLRPLRWGDRAVIRFCQVGGGVQPAPGAPPPPLTSPPRCAAPCQPASLSGPRAPRGAGGAGPPGWRGWGPPDKQAPSLCAEAGAGGRGLCPRRLGRGRMAAGAGRAVRTARRDAGVGRGCPGCWG